MPKPRSKRKLLAKPGDPLILPDGSALMPDGAVPDQSGLPPTPTALTPSTFRASQQRALSELPAEPSMLNACAVIFLYSVLGVSDAEICQATKLDKADLRTIRNHNAYTACFDLVISEFISADSALLVSRIAAYSHGALNQVAEVAFKGKKEETKLRASIDILDRAGVRPKDNDARKITVNNELRIVIDDGTKKPTLELNGEQIS